MWLSDNVLATVFKNVTLAVGGVANNASNGNLLAGYDLGTGVTSVVDTDASNGTFSITDDDTNPTWSYTHVGFPTRTDSVQVTFTGSTGAIQIQLSFLMNEAPLSDTYPVTGYSNSGNFDTGVSVYDGEDPEDDSFTITGFDTTGTLGLVTLVGGETFWYDPNGAFDALAAGATQLDSFTFTLEDSYGASSESTVNVTITGVDESGNAAPVAQPNSFNIVEGGLGTQDDLDNGDNLGYGLVDPTSTSWTYTLETQATNGTATINTDGTFVYVHNGSETLSDSFQYRVTDDGGLFDIETVTIEITPVNDPPTVSQAMSFTVDRNTTATEADLDAGTNLLSFVTDPEGQSLSVDTDITTPPNNGVVTVFADGTFSYTANDTANTSDSFVVTVYEDAAPLNEVEVTVNVTINNTAIGDLAANFDKITVVQDDELTQETTHNFIFADSFAPTAGRMLFVLAGLRNGGDGLSINNGFIEAQESQWANNSQYALYYKASSDGTEGTAANPIVVTSGSNGNWSGIIGCFAAGYSYEASSMVDTGINQAGADVTTPSLTPTTTEGAYIGFVMANSDVTWNDPPDTITFAAASPAVLQAEVADPPNTTLPFAAVASKGFTSAPGALDVNFTTDDSGGDYVLFGMVVDGTPTAQEGIDSGVGGGAPGSGGSGTNGTPITGWSSFTPPITPTVAGDITAKAHPRIFFDAANIAATRTLMGNAAYTTDKAIVDASTDMWDQAFQWVINQDTTARDNVITAITQGVPADHLQGSGQYTLPAVTGIGENQSRMLNYAICFTAVYNDMTAQQRTDAVANIEAMWESVAPEGAHNVVYSLNDDWMKGPAFSTILALALFGHSTRADAHILSCYKMDDPTVFNPYGWGACNWLKQMAFDSGGAIRPGTDGVAATGYEGMYGDGLLLWYAWQNSMDNTDDLFAHNNFFEKYPEYVYKMHYGSDGIDNGAKFHFEALTSGNYSSANTQGLAKWFCDQVGYTSRARSVFMLLGDRTVSAITPTTYGIPESSKLDGTNCIVNLQDENNKIKVFYRHWDTQRFEPDSGALLWLSDGEYILSGGVTGKTGYRSGGVSELWIVGEDLEDQQPIESPAQIGSYDEFPPKLKSNNNDNNNTIMGFNPYPYFPVSPWEATTAYIIDDLVVVTTGAYAGRHLKCSVAGTSGSTAPTGAGTDGTVTWIVDPDEALIEGVYRHNEVSWDSNFKYDANYMRGRTAMLGSTYSGGLNNIAETADRANTAEDAAETTKPYYRPENLTTFATDANGFNAVIDNTDLTLHSNVTKLERTVDFDDTLGTNGRLVVTDAINIPAGLRAMQVFRLKRAPTSIVGNVVTTPDLTITYSGPNASIHWMGGDNKELAGPWMTAFASAECMTWCPGAYYNVGDVVQVHAGLYRGRFLECSVAGTTDGTAPYTAPSGAGTDGTVTWIVAPGEYLGSDGFYHHCRDWTGSETVVAGNIRRLSSGRFLECSVGGTTHASTEPTGAGTDGTVTWIVPTEEVEVRSGEYFYRPLQYWHGNGKHSVVPGYSVDSPTTLNSWGLGYLVIEADSYTANVEFTMTSTIDRA